MDKIFLKKRQYYFGFLFFSFVYFGVAMLLIKKVKPFSLKLIHQILMTLGAFIPAILYFLRNKKVTLKGYIFLLILGQFPMVIGFLLSLTYKNFLYLLVMFPVFVLGYLIIIPVERRKNGLSKSNK